MSSQPFDPLASSSPLIVYIDYKSPYAYLAIAPTYLIYHVVTPVPLVVAIKQIVYDTIRVLLMGVVVAWINR